MNLPIFIHFPRTMEGFIDLFVLLSLFLLPSLFLHFFISLLRISGKRRGVNKIVREYLKSFFQILPVKSSAKTEEGSPLCLWVYSLSLCSFLSIFLSLHISLAHIHTQGGWSQRMAAHFAERSNGMQRDEQHAK